MAREERGGCAWGGFAVAGFVPVGGVGPGGWGRRKSAAGERRHLPGAAGERRAGCRARGRGGMAAAWQRGRRWRRRGAKCGLGVEEGVGRLCEGVELGQEAGEAFLSGGRCGLEGGRDERRGGGAEVGKNGMAGEERGTLVRGEAIEEGEEESGGGINVAHGVSGGDRFAPGPVEGPQGGMRGAVRTENLPVEGDFALRGNLRE